MNPEFQILDFIQHLRSPAMDFFMLLFSHLGDYGIIWILLAFLLTASKKYRLLGVTVWVGLLIDLVIVNDLMKPLVARMRPYEINTAITLLIKAPLDFSFPSGHTAASFVVVTVLFCHHPRFKYWLMFLLLAFLIAFSRLYLYVHFPSDVLGGAVIGILMGLAAHIIVQKLKKADVLPFV